MGSLAFPARGRQSEADVPRQADPSERIVTRDGAVPVPDRETRRVLGVLLHTLDRLSE